MDFLRFTIANTNIFPIANSHQGGQYTTEWNLRSRESVDTDPNVKYFIGPSFTHGPEDFAISQQLGSSTTIEVAPGRAVVNGHYIESLAPVEVDIADANITAGQQGQPILTGELCVGLRIMYSTEATMAGSMMAETSDDAMYPGIKVVVLPKSGANKFTTPSDSPTDQSAVNAHLLLGTFQYVNGAISGITQNDAKYKNIDAARVTNIEQLVSDEYISKRGLQPHNLYVFAGKASADSSTVDYDTWCAAQDSLMIWDNTPVIDTTSPSPKSEFTWDSITGETVLVLAHKQVDGMVNQSNVPIYYQDKVLRLPAANYVKNLPGTVTPEYTANVKNIEAIVDKLYNLPNGKCRKYIETIGYGSNIADVLPAIQSGWTPGDYVVVARDFTQLNSDDSNTTPPSTLYVVLPPMVTDIAFESSQSSSAPDQTLADGLEIGYESVDIPNFNPSAAQTITDIKAFFNIPTDEYRGISDKDYFLVYDEQAEQYHFYKVSAVESASMKYSDVPIRLTSEIDLATETTIGGFRNAPPTYGEGYVVLDENGNLRVLDFDLLASGIDQYRLGADYAVSTGLTASAIQEELDENVNERIAFAVSASSTSVKPIKVTIPLSVEDNDATITIRNIDSRFNTPVRIVFTGTADEHTTINIIDCEKIKLDLNYSGSPSVNLYRCGLWYDANVLSNLDVIEGLTLWYDKIDLLDPDILVDGMTVIQQSMPETSETVDYWNEVAINDNHYQYALKSLTFGSDGNIIGCTLCVGDDITSNLADGTYLSVFKFELPQSLGLQYPVNRVTKELKVTGCYVSAYPVTSPNGYKTNTTTFSALTDTYDASTTGSAIGGSIAFQTVTTTVSVVSGVDPGTTIDALAPKSYHIFQGGTIE